MTSHESNFEITDLQSPEPGVFRFQLQLDEFAPENTQAQTVKFTSLELQTVEDQPLIDLLGGDNVGLVLHRNNSMELQVSRAIDTFEYAIALKADFIEDQLIFSAAFYYADHVPDASYRPSSRLVRVVGTTTFEEKINEHAADATETEDQS